MVDGVVWLVLFSLACCVQSIDDVFSGIYTPNVHYSLESYAGAWLIKREVFMTLDRMIDGMGSLETASTMVVQNHRIIPVMTRDYFDFQVEHLSSTTNQLRNHNADDVLLHRLVSKGRNLRRIAETFPDKRSDVLVIIPFSTNAASEASTAKTMLQKLRWGFFTNTFFSIYRYFPRVVVFVSSLADRQLLLDNFVPAHDIITLPQQPQGWQHPRQALRFAYDRLKSDAAYDWVQYVYYSEGDQILHARHTERLLQLLQDFRGEKSLALVPHRMQVYKTMHILLFDRYRRSLYRRIFLCRSVMPPEMSTRYDRKVYKLIFCVMSCSGWKE